MDVKVSERKKANFITDYRTLCEEHGMMVIQVAYEEEEYHPFAVARIHREILAEQIQDMLVEKIHKLTKDS